MVFCIDLQFQNNFIQFTYDMRKYNGIIMTLLQYADVWKIPDTPPILLHNNLQEHEQVTLRPLVYTQFTLSIWSGHTINLMSET